MLAASVEFDDTHTLTVGGEPIELTHARGETDDHLWAWLPERRTIMAGDFLIWHFPNAGNPGGADVLIARAADACDVGNLRLACHLADLAGWAAPADPAIHRRRAAIYEARSDAEPSLMSKGIFAAAARESEAVVTAAENDENPR